MPESRTKRTIQNSKVSLIFFIIQILVGFYSRKIFLEYLGDEIIGLNTTLGNILSFLNLAELGIGIAMATSLYKPIHDENHDAIVDIITVQGILYRRIALILCSLSIPVLIALPFIFPNIKCGIIYVYIAYFVFLSGSLFSYLWNYRQVLIQADQKNYKLDPWINAVRFIKIFLQIAFLLFTPFGIWGWIGAEFVGNVMCVLAINHVIRKEYPWLHQSKESTKVLLQRHKILLTKTKQLFVHKIGGFVLTQTSPLVIYAFVSLSMVTYYSNYMILIGYSTTLLKVISTGMGASIGNLIAENNKRHTLEVFWELFSSRIWITGVACFTLYIIIDPLITLWIGSKYLLSESTLLLLIVMMFIRISRTVIDSFREAYQLFGDIWAPIIEACLNLGGSILFGYLWGLNGVLLGVNLSLIVIVLLWKPYYTFRYGMKSSVTHYFIQYSIHLSVLLAGAIISRFAMNQINDGNDNLIATVIAIILGLATYIITTYAILYFCTKGMRMFTIRIKNILAHKI
jgi:O-antigen/teichoic acid export membrane protein